MRPLEILLPLILGIYLLWPLSGRLRPSAVGILPAFGLVIMATHARIEGMRWQMVPLYALGIVLFIASLAAFVRARTGAQAGRSLAGPLGGLALLLVFTALPVLFPVPALQTVSGPYAVGTETFMLVDDSRPELYSGQEEARRFLIQLWYPASPAPGDARAPWMEDAAAVAPAIAEYLELPRFSLGHLTLARTAAFNRAAVDLSGAPYPVLVFSHGWNGFRAQSTFLMQELASHGYVVVAVEHTYGARLTVFPDGQIAPNNPAALPDGLPTEEYEAAARILVDQWAGDIGYTLDNLARWNQAATPERFSGMFDLARVGLIGHSTGGGAAIEFCGRDPRCKAGFPLDAFMRPVSVEVLDGGVRQPFAFFFSELWPFKRNTELFDRFYAHLPGSTRVLTILGADHYDFSDLPALSPLAHNLKLKGPIPGAEVQSIIQTYVLAFFDLHLQGIPTTLFDGPSEQFPAVRFDR